MPAASYTSSLSWGAYAAASLALVLICLPTMTLLRNIAYAGSADETARGAANVFDRLSPGVTTSFSFHSPASDGRIDLAGRSLTVFWGGKSSTVETSWSLPNETLRPELRYSLRLLGDSVEVSEIV